MSTLNGPDFHSQRQTAGLSFTADGLSNSKGVKAAKTQRLNISGLNDRTAVAILSGPFKGKQAWLLKKLVGARFIKVKMNGKTFYVNSNSAEKRLHMTALKTLESDRKLSGRVRGAEAIDKEMGTKLQDAFEQAQTSKLGELWEEYEHHYAVTENGQLKDIGWNSKELIDTIKVVMGSKLENGASLMMKVKVAERGTTPSVDRSILVETANTPSPSGARYTIHAIATESLGDGSFGVASKALDTLGRQMKCVKESKQEEGSEEAETAKKDLETEEKHLKKLNEGRPKRGIQEQYELVVNTPNKVGAIGLTKLYDGDAYALLYTKEGSSTTEYSEYSIRERKELVGDLYSGLNVLTEEGLIHADLKPENIFVSKPQGNRTELKIADFGGVRELTSIGSASNFPTCTPNYTAEKDVKAYQTPASTAETKQAILQAHVVFSSALVAYELLVGEASTLNTQSSGYGCMIGLRGEAEAIGVGMKAELINKGGLREEQAKLLLRAMSDDYNKRPSMKKLAEALIPK